MKRTQVQLDESTYQLLRRMAFEKEISMAGLIRQVLQEHLGTRPARRRRVEDFTFIGSGYSNESKFDPISERHDEALAEDLAEDLAQ
jgi:hypothetical protein